MSTKLVEINLPEASAQGAYDVIKSGKLAMGEKTKELEAKFSEYTHGLEAVFVSSGTAALVLGLMALNIKPGDEVIIPSFTFDATAEAVAFLGASPVFADIGENFGHNPEAYVIDPDSVARMMGPKVRAIIPVDLYGYAAPALDHLGVPVLEDAAQAIGSSWAGRSSTAAIFSLYATKQLTSGEGGMFITSNKGLADKVRKLRSHGQSAKYRHEYLSINFAPTDVAAAIALPQFEGLAAELKARHANASLYNRLFGYDYFHTRTPSLLNSTFHQYTVQVDCRENVMKALDKEGIEYAVHYPTPVHLQPWAIGRYRVDGEMKNTRIAAAMSLSLPVGSHVSSAEIEFIAKVVREANHV